MSTPRKQPPPDHGLSRTEPMRVPPVSMPTRFGRYEIERELGRGGMGVVHLAFDPSLHRRVALKSISSAAFAGPDELRRFEREARLAAGIQHPNIVRIYEVGQIEGRVYYTMDLIEGETLADRIEDGSLTIEQTVGIMALLADAVDHLHDKGILHRDLKPANIMIREGGQPVLMDFGLARQFESSTNLSLSRAIVGTPPYMSPEQTSGDPSRIGPASDVYGLGAILYCCLTGHPPFLGPTHQDIFNQINTLDPVKPSVANDDVDADLTNITLKCLAKEPWARYASALALANDLKRHARGEPVVARPASLAERATKFVRRNPVPVGIATAAALVIVGVTSIAFQRIVASRQRAEAALEEAREARDRAQESERRVRDQAEALARSLQQERANLALSYLDRGRVDLGAGQSARAWAYLAESLAIANSLEARLLLSLARGQSLPPARLLDSSTPGSLVAVSHDGALIAIGKPNGVSIVRPDEPGSTRWLPPVHGKLSALDFHPERRLLACAGGQESVLVFDLERPDEEPRRFSTGQTSLSAMKFHPGGRSIVTGGRGIPLVQIDLETGRLTRIPFAHPFVEHLAIGALGRSMAVSYGGGTASIWSFATRAWGPETDSIDETQVIQSLALDPMELVLAVAHKGGRIAFHAVGGGRVRRQVLGSSGSQMLAMSPNGTTMAIAGTGTEITILDMGTLLRRFVLTGHRAPVTGIAFRNDGRELVSTSADGTTLLWSLQPQHFCGVGFRHQREVTRVLWQDSDRVLSWCRDGRIAIFQGRDGYLTHLSTARVHGYVDFHPTEPWIAAAFGGKLRLLAATTGRPLADIECDPETHAVAFVGPKSLAVSEPLGRLRLIDLEAAPPTSRTVQLSDRIDGLFALRDGRIVSRFQKWFQVVDPGTGVVSERVRTAGNLLAIDTRSDKALVTASRERIQVWRGAEQIASYEPDGTRIHSAIGVPGSQSVLVGLSDGRLLLLDEDLQLQATMTSTPSPVSALSARPDGGAVAAGQNDGTVRIWILDVLDQPVDDIVAEARRESGWKLEGMRLVPNGEE